MRIKLYLSLLILAVSLKTTAQIITLRGKITNAKTGAAVPAASILSGSFGTSADESGNFVFYVQQSIIEESGITVRSIGYQTVHIADITDNFKVILTPIAQELKTVDISALAETIVEKAYRKIPNNYLDKNFNITGLERMVNSVKDTFGYQYYYWNNAKVKHYMSAYPDTPAVVQVGLIAKEDNAIRNPRAMRINFVSGYTLVHDYVHERALILKGDLKYFTYRLNRKEWIDGTRVYVVNFFSRSKEHPNAGILYIDTASNAFVRVLYTKYNVKVKGSIDWDKITVFIQYKKYDDKWVLDAYKYNSIADDKGYDVERTDEFQVANLFTTAASPLPAQAIISKQSSDSQVKPYNGFTAEDKKMPKSVQKFVNSSFQKIEVPEIAKNIHGYLDRILRQAANP